VDQRLENEQPLDHAELRCARIGLFHQRITNAYHLDVGRLLLGVNKFMARNLDGNCAFKPGNRGTPGGILAAQSPPFTTATQKQGDIRT
jgi:hypothetical protein